MVATWPPLTYRGPVLVRVSLGCFARGMYVRVLESQRPSTDHGCWLYQSASGSIYSSGITPRPPSRPPRAGRPYHALHVSVPFTPHKPFRGLSVLSRGETPLAAVRKHRGTDCLRSRPPYRPESQSPRPVPLPTPPAPPRSPGRTARSLLRRSPTACRQRFDSRLRG